MTSSQTPAIVAYFDEVNKKIQEEIPAMVTNTKRKFAVGYFTSFNNNLYTTIVEADSAKDAMLKILVGEYWNIEDIKNGSIEAIKQFAFDCDCMVDAIEVHPDTPLATTKK